MAPFRKHPGPDPVCCSGCKVSSDSTLCFGVYWSLILATSPFPNSLRVLACLGWYLAIHRKPFSICLHLTKSILMAFLLAVFFLHSLLLNYNDPSLRQSIYRLQRTRPDATGCSPPARPLPDFPEALAGFELVHRPSPDVPASFVS